jgi:NAD(P)-dependent dehydrogenase (short-subunit alcohol dehydrogenase family)
MRAVVVGGTGNFGARICRALAADGGLEVIAAARTGAAARLDLDSPDFAGDLAKLAPGLVIHCAGPFQGQDYRVALASLAAGAHYLDLADARAFVARFADALDAPARAAGRIALSGASTLPALSAAVVDALAARLASIDSIRIAIAPGQRAPRGAATIAGVLSYAGRPFRWLSGGAWRTVHGWQALERVRFAFGTRWAAACDVPDLELFPARYPGVRTVEFRAALEIGAQHFALWAAAALRRAGVALPLERGAATLDRLARLMDVLGGDRGGMRIALEGARADGTRARVEWQLTVDAMHGPEIPCLAALVLARKLARGALRETGAFACMGFLELAELEREFAKWSITTVMEERSA